MNIEPCKVEKVLAIITLHNLLKRQASEVYQPTGSVDRKNFSTGAVDEGFWRQFSGLEGMERHRGGNSSETSKKIREDFTKYFMNEGAVSWESRMAGLD